ncbi:MAG: formate dehydrogenase [Betaproteobacteria bacterium]
MKQPQNTLSRRTLFAAGTLGTMAAGASLVSLAPAPVASAALPKHAPAAGGGYILSAHVQRYYKTAHV